MKSNTTFIFAGIMSAIIGNAYATGENTVTSKSYVDAEVATKQNIIPANNSETYPYGSVVAYGDTDGEPGAMGVYGLDAYLDDNFSAEEKALILSNLGYGTDDLELEDSKLATSAEIDWLSNSKANHMTCAGWPASVRIEERTDENCWLWNKN